MSVWYKVADMDKSWIYPYQPQSWNKLLCHKSFQMLFSESNQKKTENLPPALTVVARYTGTHLWGNLPANHTSCLLKILEFHKSQKPCQKINIPASTAMLPCVVGQLWAHRWAKYANVLMCSRYREPKSWLYSVPLTSCSWGLLSI